MVMKDTKTKFRLTQQSECSFGRLLPNTQWRKHKQVSMNKVSIFKNVNAVCVLCYYPTMHLQIVGQAVYFSLW